MNRPTSVYLTSLAGTFWLLVTALCADTGRGLAGDWRLWLPLLGVAMIAEAFQVASAGGDRAAPMSFSGAAHVAAAILFGPLVAALIAAVAVVLVDGARTASVRLVAANAALFGWSILLAGVAYQLAGGHPGSVTADSAPALIVLVAARGLVNMALFSLGEALAGEISPWPALRGVLADGAVTYAGEGSLGVLMAAGWNSRMWVILPFLAPLFGALYRAQANLERLRGETAAALSAFARVIDERDPNTARHTERVAAYVERFTRVIGMPGREAARLVEAARYHDLGKVAIDEATLSKPGRLDPAEVRAIRRHPRLSAALLSPFGFAREIARYVELHHERHDGRGYYAVPAEEIPLEAHVLIVADCFDAMTSARAYRPPLSDEEAAQELLDKSGSQFHPDVAAAFAAMIRGQEPEAALVPDALARLRAGFESVVVWRRPNLHISDDPWLLTALLGGIAMVLGALASTSSIRVIVLAAAVLLSLPAAGLSLRRRVRRNRALGLVGRGAAIEYALAAVGLTGRPHWLVWNSDTDTYGSGRTDLETDEVCRRAVLCTGRAVSRLATGRYVLISRELPDRRRLAVVTDRRPRSGQIETVERLAALGAAQPEPPTDPTEGIDRTGTPLQIDLGVFERVRTGAGQLAAEQVVRDAVEAVAATLRAGDTITVTGDDTLLVWSIEPADDLAVTGARIRSALAGVALPKRVAPIEATIDADGSRPRLEAG